MQLGSNMVQIRAEGISLKSIQQHASIQMQRASIQIHLHQSMSLTPYVTCPSSDTGFCSHNAQISGTSAAEPPEQPADIWELEVGRVLFVLPMKCCSATTSSEVCLLSITAWNKENLGQEMTAAFRTLCAVLVFQSVQRWDLNLVSYFNYLDCTFNTVLQICLSFLFFTYILAHLMC